MKSILFISNGEKFNCTVSRSANKSSLTKLKRVIKREECDRLMSRLKMFILWNMEAWA